MVESLLRRGAACIGSDRSVREGAQRLVEQRVDCLVVVRNDKLAGILTGAEVADAVARGLDLDKAHIKEVMVDRVLTIKPTADVSEAAALLRKPNVRYLVVKLENRLFGVVSARDLVRNEEELARRLRAQLQFQWRD